MTKQKNLKFKVISDSSHSARHSAGCSNAPRSTCCTRVCTRQDGSNTDMAAWENYLEANAGVLQY
ncbi:hypothetical protein B9T19_05600 [Ignatzschineria sp. F8392]|nr:hypothetical protein B9T19_05600 [Ignatzschineria sp. F8392]